MCISALKLFEVLKKIKIHITIIITRAGAVTQEKPKV
jgi:hypothetical protein